MFEVKNSLVAWVGVGVALSVGACGSAPADDSLVEQSEARSALIDGGVVSFGSAPLGPYSTSQAEADFDTENVPYVAGNAEVASNCATGGRCLRVRYPRGQAGGNTGAQFPIAFENPTQEATLHYDVYFEPGFDWDGDGASGGKLPGLCGGNCPTGGPWNDPGTTQAKNGEGFSARFMWREGGRLVVYLYYRDMPGDFGQDLDMDDGYSLPIGRTVRVTQYIRVNTGNNTNGVLRVWIDGDLKLDRTNLRFMTQSPSIDEFFFSTFYGGSTSEWSPSRDTFAQFDNIDVTTSSSDVPPTPSGCFEPRDISVIQATEWWQEFGASSSYRNVEVEFRNNGGDAGRYGFDLNWGKWVSPGGIRTPSGTDARLFITDANGDAGRTNWSPFEVGANVNPVGCR